MQQPILDERVLGFEQRDGREYMVVERKGRKFGIPAENAARYMKDMGLEYDASTLEKAQSLMSGAEDVASRGQREKVRAAKSLKGPGAEVGGGLARNLATGLAPFTFGLTAIPQVQSAAESFGRWTGAKLADEDTTPYEQGKEREALKAAEIEARAPDWATAGRVITGLTEGALTGGASAAAGRGMVAAGAARGAPMMTGAGRAVSTGIPTAMAETAAYTAGKSDLGKPREAAENIAFTAGLTGGIGLIGVGVGRVFSQLRAAKAQKRLEPLVAARDQAEALVKQARGASDEAAQKLAAAERAYSAALEAGNEAQAARAKEYVVRVTAELDSVSPARIAQLEQELADANRMIEIQRGAANLQRGLIAERGPRADAYIGFGKPKEEGLGALLDAVGQKADDVVDEAGDVFASSGARSVPVPPPARAAGAADEASGVFASRVGRVVRDAPELDFSGLQELNARPGAGGVGSEVKSVAARPKAIQAARQAAAASPSPTPSPSPSPSPVARAQPREALLESLDMIEGRVPWGPPPPMLQEALAKQGLTWPTARPPAAARGKLYRMAANVLEDETGLELTRLPGLERRDKVLTRNKEGEQVAVWPRARAIKTNVTTRVDEGPGAMAYDVPRPPARAPEPISDPRISGVQMADPAMRRAPPPRAPRAPEPEAPVTPPEPPGSRLAEIEAEIAASEAMARRLRADLARERAAMRGKFDKTLVGRPEDVEAMAKGKDLAEELSALGSERVSAADRARRAAASEAVDADLALRQAESGAAAAGRKVRDEFLISEREIESLTKGFEKTMDRADRAALNPALYLAAAAVASGNPFAAAVGGAVMAGAAARRYAPKLVVSLQKKAGYLEPALKTAAQATKTTASIDPERLMEQHRKRMAEDPEYAARMTEAATELDSIFKRQEAEKPKVEREQQPKAEREQPPRAAARRSRRKGETEGTAALADWFAAQGRRVTSTTRSMDENDRTRGGARNSRHLKGAAIDIGASDRATPQRAVRDLTMAYAELKADKDAMRHVRKVVLEIPRSAKYRDIDLPEEKGLIVVRRDVNGPHLHIETR